MESIVKPLLNWYELNKRPLPWRRDTDPYHIWISEIMLQQTRIEAAKNYYERFINALPDVSALASADEETVLKLWEGLGYYSRARNLHRTAGIIMTDHNGEFPKSSKELRALPGIGDYTAGAIASIAFGEQVAAVDGNVMRVVSRLKACGTGIADTKYRTSVARELSAVSPEGHAGDFTSAIMELGEVICVPGTPNCYDCPLSSVCAAHAVGKETAFPVMPEKKPRRIEYKNIMLYICGKKVAVQKRPEKGLLAGLWEYPAEASVPEGAEYCGSAIHVFSHIEWHMQGYVVHLENETVPYRFVNAQERETLAVPAAFRFFSQYLTSLGH